MADTLAHQFIAALHAGRACLHPTDTLPGLTFDPGSSAGLNAVLALKGQRQEKPFLGLVPSLAMARRFFAPLPGDWERILTAAWPGPLSVVWQASAAAPRSMVAADGTIGLRVPQLPLSAAWFREVLEGLQFPLPTTSVNRSGEPPAKSFAAACDALAAAPGCYAPRWLGDGGRESSVPSSIIRLHGDGAFSLLRDGALTLTWLAGQAPQVG